MQHHGPLLARFMFGKLSVQKAIAVGTVLLSLATACSSDQATQTNVSDGPQPTQAQAQAPLPHLRRRPLRRPQLTSHQSPS